MNVVCFYDKNKNRSPVREYLDQYKTGPSLSREEKKEREKILIKIDAKIQYLKSINGLPQPPTAKPLKGERHHELCVSKNDQAVIRINYQRRDGRICLLNVYEKPAKKTKERNTKRIIESANLEAARLIKQLDEDPKSYIPYE